MKYQRVYPILHSTSDILGIVKNDKGIQITIYGDRDLEGEIVLEGRNTDKIKSAELDGNSIDLVCKEDRLVINYSHNHKKEQILIIKLR